MASLYKAGDKILDGKGNYFGEISESEEELGKYKYKITKFDGSEVELEQENIIETEYHKVKS